MASSSSLASDYIHYFRQFLPPVSSGLDSCPNTNLLPSSAQNLPLMGANARFGTVNQNPVMNILNQNTQNLGVPSTSNNISPQPSLLDGNPGTSILNQYNTHNLGLPTASNNFLPPHFVQIPVAQNPRENRPALQNPTKSSAAVWRNSERTDDYSLSFVPAEGSNRASRSIHEANERILTNIPSLERGKANAANSILGKRSNPAPSIEAANKHARHGSLRINDSLGGGRDNQTGTTTSRRGRKPDTQKIDELRERLEAQQSHGAGDLYDKLTRGPCIPSLMTSDDLFGLGIYNFPATTLVTPVDRNGVGFMSGSSSTGGHPTRNYGGFVAGNSNSSLQRPANKFSLYDFNWNIKPFAPNSSIETRKWQPVDQQGNTQGIGILGDQQIGSSFNVPKNQSFLTFERSQTGILGDHQQMTSSFNVQNNQSFQTIPFLSSQTGIQSCNNPQGTNDHDTLEDIDEMISSMLNLPSDHQLFESGQSDPQQSNTELLSAAPVQETPQQMDFEDQQILLEFCNSFKTPAVSSLSLDEPTNDRTSNENNNDAGMNVQAVDGAVTLGTNVNAENTNDVASIPLMLENNGFEDVIDWPDHHSGFDPFPYQI